MAKQNKTGVYMRTGSKFWWVSFYDRLHRKTRRVSSGIEHKGGKAGRKNAERFRARQIAALDEGRALRQNPQSLRLGHWNAETDTATGACKLLADDLTINRRRSRLNTLRQWNKHPARILGPERPLQEIDYLLLSDYVATRTSEGAAPATIKQELSFVVRVCRLAARAELLFKVPAAPTIVVNNKRERFVTAVEHQLLRTEFEAIGAPHMVDVIDMAHILGWRKGMLLNAEWVHVDWGVGELRLPGALRGNKAGKTWVIPFHEHAVLEAVITRRRAIADRLEAELGRPITHIFCYCTRGRSRTYGGPIKSHYSAWKRACKRAGITDLVLHDYRRTGSRNLTAAGVSPVAAKTLTGHITTQMFEHYSIGGTDVAGRALRQLQDAENAQAPS